MKAPEDILRLINFCKTIQRADTDPFDLDVKRFLTILSEYVRRWKSIDDLMLDAEAISELTKVIELQCKWIKDRSASFYIDPALVEFKLKLMEPAQLASAFFKAWHPIVSLDRITPERLKQGLDYWNALLPLSERKSAFGAASTPETGTLKLDDLIALHILSQTEFQEQIQQVLNELEARGRTEYYDFVYGDSFEDSVRKAYLTSYIVSEGKAELDIEPLEEKIFIYPRNGSRGQSGGSGGEDEDEDDEYLSEKRSIPIAISYEDWERWSKRREQGQSEQSGR